MTSLARRLTAEFVGTFFLLAAVVGSGIMAESLAGGNLGLVLMANAIATGAALIVLILIFSAVSGAHFNPAVTLSFLVTRKIEPGPAAGYITVQILGGIAGVVIAHVMFDQALVQDSTVIRTGLGQYVGEFVATFGLLATILGCIRYRPDATAYAVGLYISSAYWFTSSTSFANPAVTIARCLTDSFAGIRMVDVPVFILVQLAGAIAATYLFRWLVQTED